MLAGLVLLVLILPQPALADPAASITLSKTSGSCGDLVQVTASVDTAGTYRICWASRTADNRIATFNFTGAGNDTVPFVIPETVKGTYPVYLTSENYTELARADFAVVPSAKIAPEKGPVGTVVNFTGCGFNASQDVRILFLGTEVATPRTNNLGSWTANYTIPSAPASGYTFSIEFKEGTVWYNATAKYFEVTPKITAPNSGSVGQTIEVEGYGFRSRETGIKVIFRLQGTTVDVVAQDNIAADEKGYWKATVVVPTVQGGSYAIDASGATTTAADVPEVSFTLGAGILVAPSTAYVGDRITVTGGGFVAGETGIRVTMDNQVVASGITARTNGTWQYQLVLPPTTYGSHTISASGDVTRSAAPATLSVGAKIESVSPPQGAAPGDSVSVSGSGFSSSQRLTVKVGGVTVPEALQSLPNGNIAINFRVPKGSPKGRQAVLVTDAGGATASADFTVIEKILPTPQPILPRDGSLLRSPEVTFRWGGITGGGNITYTLQISNTPNVSTYVFSRSGITTASYTLSEEEALALQRGTYHWWVKAVDDYDNQSPWSPSSSFRMAPIPTWAWVVIGIAILTVLMVVAYRETKFRIAD